MQSNFEWFSLLVLERYYDSSQVLSRHPPFSLYFRSLSIARLSIKFHCLVTASSRLGCRQQLRRRLLAVSLRVIVNPSPQILTSLLHRQLRLPVQLLVCQCRVRCEVEHVTRSPGADLVWEIATNNLAEGIDDIIDGAAATGAEVPCLDTRLVLAEVVQSLEVALGKIDNVDVITNGGTVLGVVV